MTLSLAYSIRGIMQDNSPVYFLFQANPERDPVFAIVLLHFWCFHICIRTWSISKNKKKKEESYLKYTGRVPAFLGDVVAEGVCQNLCFHFWALSLILISHGSYAPVSLTLFHNSQIFSPLSHKILNSPTSFLLYFESLIYLSSSGLSTELWAYISSSFYISTKCFRGPLNASQSTTNLFFQCSQTHHPVQAGNLDIISESSHSHIS